ncbi:MAG: bifunctional diguanylate cyclase/phosphodiesterase, partial [Synergistaceae bacterium]
DEIHKFMELASKDPVFFNARYSLKFAVGIDVVPSRDFDFDVSYAKIRNVCRMTSSDEQIYQINQLGTEKETSGASAFCQEYGDVHSQHNLDLYMESINTLRHEHDYDKKINELLAVMGRFFKAERTYVFTVHDSVWGDCLHEWSRCGIKSVMKGMSNIHIPSEEPILYKSITSGEIIIASAGEYETEEERAFMEGRGIKRLVAVPIDIAEGRSGFLGIENSSENLDNMGVLNTLSYMIASEERKLFFKKRDEYILYHDEMTGLLNGNSYRDQLTRIDRDSLSTLGVMCLDINGLKSINSRYGMDYGDSIVSHCSIVLRRYFSENEVFRLFGDEFRIICPDMERSSFVRCTEKVIEDINSFMHEAAESGWAWSDSEIDPDSLMLVAEEIMSVRKKEYYRRSGKASEADHTRMYETLMSDIDNGAYIMYLQPKVEISTGKICGAEALARAYYPDRGIVPPAKFIEPLEKENLIHFIDFFMFEEVCKILARWIKLGCLHMTVSVNFSRLTLLCPETPDKIKALCRSYSVPNSMIEIEVTETLGSVSESSIKEVTEQIARDGFPIALDDFGARYSNLSIMAGMDLHTLKLDKSIIHEIVANKKSLLITKRVIELCKDLGIKSTAEGIETEEQLNVLKKLGCKYAQGYLFNKPIPADDFETEYLGAYVR